MYTWNYLSGRIYVRLVLSYSLVCFQPFINMEVDLKRDLKGLFFFFLLFIYGFIISGAFLYTFSKFHHNVSGTFYFFLWNLYCSGLFKKILWNLKSEPVNTLSMVPHIIAMNRRRANISKSEKAKVRSLVIALTYNLETPFKSFDSLDSSGKNQWPNLTYFLLSVTPTCFLSLFFLHLCT